MLQQERPKIFQSFSLALLGGEHKTKTSHELKTQRTIKGKTIRNSVDFCQKSLILVQFQMFQGAFLCRSHTGKKEEVQLEEKNTSSLTLREGGGSSNNHCPLLTRQLFGSSLSKSPVELKVHRHGSPRPGTGEAECPLTPHRKPEAALRCAAPRRAH